MTTARILLSCALAATAIPLAAQAQDTRFYRYELSTSSGDTRYVEEVPNGNGAIRFGVVRGKDGRITSVRTLRSGKTVSESGFIYASPTDTLPASFDVKDDGTPNGTVHVTRDASGRRVRAEARSVQGAMTGYTTYTYLADGVMEEEFSPEGKSTQRYLRHYAANGSLSGYRWFVTGAFYDNVVDSLTGLKISRTKTTDGVTGTQTKYTYDDGEIAREDAYNAQGVWFAALEFSDGLLTRKSYKLSSGITKESVIRYDGRRPLEARFTFNGVFICTLKYDLYPDGKVKRTLAIGPDGSLWAEYPDMEIDEVRQNGQPLNREGAVIHRPGNWW